MPIHGLMAGVCLGCNNFLLSEISDLGLNATFIFSLGALMFSIVYNSYYAILSKKETGSFWSVHNSNLFQVNENGKTVLNKCNFVGLLIRTALNMGF